MTIAARTARFIVLIALAGFAGSACLTAGRSPESNEPPDRTERGSSADARVTNRTGFSLRLYAASETGQRTFLGSVGSFGSAAFRIPESVIRSTDRIQLVALPAGARRSYSSDPVLPRAGDVIHWTILTERGRSTIRVGPEADDTTGARPGSLRRR